MTSQEINSEVGDIIRRTFSKNVKLKNPELEFRIEIVDDFALIGFEKIKDMEDCQLELVSGHLV